MSGDSASCPERGRILVVDDEAGVREVLQEKLSRAGFECEGAASAEEAESLLKTAPAEVVLCDIRMPRRSGMELLRWMRQRQPDTAVVMVTAVSEVGAAVESLKAGALDYITKPFNLDEVVLATERALELRRLRLENREYQVSLEDKVREQSEKIEALLGEAARAKVADSLSEVSRALTEMKDLELTLEKILEAVLRIIGAERGAAFLYQERTGYRLGANHSVGNRGIQELTRFVHRLLGDEPCKAPFLSVSPLGDERLAGDRYVKRNRLSSLVCVPLCVGDKLLGSLYADTRGEAFDTRLCGEEFFQAFGSLAAVAVTNSMAHRDLRTEVKALRDEVAEQHQFDGIIGVSSAMQEVFSLVHKLKHTDTTVLIMGESGTGKEMIARLIHRLSPRADRAFIPVNCAALPSELIESELFGIEKGTATGVDARIGKFEAANAGTVFLDEIGDLPAMAQAKILRVLQEKVLERVGSHHPVELDIRLIAATNADLRTAVDRKEFREDLYYRLHVMPIYIPPLRDRREDIPHLVTYYTERFCREMKKPVFGIDEKTMESFVQPIWRGNIRELKNAVERAVILSEGEWLTTHVESPAQASRQAVLDLEPALNRSLSERELVNSYARMAFERFKRFDRTCEFLGISFKTLKKRLELEGKQSARE